MNSKLSFIIIGICLSYLIVSRWMINWEKITQRNVEDRFEEIIAEQRIDLEAWKGDRETNFNFRKRTFCQGRLEKWSDEHPFIFNSTIDSIGVLESELGLFLVQVISQNKCEYVSIFPLNNIYGISNKYLKNSVNPLLHTGVKRLSLTPGDYQFEDLFYYGVSPRTNRIADALTGFVIVFLLLFEFFKFGSRNEKTFVLGSVAIGFIRIVSLKYGGLIYLFRFPLFDPINYSASFFNPTLGDLFVNCTLILLFIILLLRHLRRFSYSTYGVSFLSILGSGAALLLYYATWSILDNSQLTLDVGDSISFPTLRLVAYLCILVIAAAYFLLSYFIFSQLYNLKNAAIPIIVAALPLIPILILNPKASPVLFLHVLLLVASSRITWGSGLKNFKYINLLLMLFISVGFAATLSYTVYKYHEESELDSKRKFGNYLLLKRDVLGEYYLDQTISELSSDSVLAEIGSTGSKEDVLVIIKTQFLNPYFNKYELDIVFQDYHQLKLNTRFTREYSLLTKENQSDYENIFFIDEGMSFKYICKINLGDLVGLIILQIKKRVPTSVYPALLMDSKYFAPSDDFDYAVFARGDILFHRSKFGQGEWPQEDDFQNEDLFNEGIEKNERHYFGVKTNDGRTILIISNKYKVRAQLTNFSFFFLLLLFSFGLMVLLSTVRLKVNQLNFTSKIQLYLGLAFIIPLFTAGFALLSSLNTSYREEINRSYQKQTLYISEILSESIEEDIKIDQKRLSEIGNFIQSDLSYYNSSGYLIATSQPEIFNLNLQSNLINPIVFSELIEKENQSMIADESMGTLDYKVSYAVVSSGIESDVVGFIAMPFFDSKNHLKRQQIEVFGNLISIFGLIFIIAIVFGNAVLNNLLHPLRMVAGKIRKVTLQEVNKPILYEASDEIGSLVKDYNHMLVKLEDSKLALARSQKETAWKEIAKQVAHEIKNPLTPMRLKIQQMQRKHEVGSKEYDTLSSLLSQVDTLSQIAESFSAFAEMPAPDNQVFEISRLVKQVVGLYQADNVNINLDIQDGIEIDADKDIFRRILNNIVLNAIQSVENKDAEIKIVLAEKSNKCLLSVSDNGRGVPDELKDKIFLNYFSTKTTGSGIGLALAKKGIENAGGNIWFESTKDEGTTFFISMPLAAR